MKAIVGLGNPGREYEFTRHNIGFIALDAISDHWNSESFKQKFQGLCTEARMGTEKIILVKPQTYMNLSGQSVLAMAQFYKLNPEDILVIYDDLDLPLGKLRARYKGGHGGHNGIKSIIGQLGTEEFPRLKLGIGRPPGQQKASSYVLENFRKEEDGPVQTVVEEVLKACDVWVKEGIFSVMNRFNADKN